MVILGAVHVPHAALRLGEFAVRFRAIPRASLSCSLTTQPAPPWIEKPAFHGARAIIEERVEPHIRQGEKTEPKLVARLILEPVIFQGIR